MTRSAPPPSSEGLTKRTLFTRGRRPPPNEDRPPLRSEPLVGQLGFAVNHSRETEGGVGGPMHPLDPRRPQSCGYVLLSLGLVVLRGEHVERIHDGPPVALPQG